MLLLTTVRSMPVRSDIHQGFHFDHSTDNSFEAVADGDQQVHHWRHTHRQGELSNSLSFLPFTISDKLVRSNTCPAVLVNVWLSIHLRVCPTSCMADYLSIYPLCPTMAVCVRASSVMNAFICIFAYPAFRSRHGVSATASKCSMSYLSIEVAISLHAYFWNRFCFSQDLPRQQSQHIY